MLINCVFVLKVKDMLIVCLCVCGGGGGGGT